MRQAELVKAFPIESAEDFEETTAFEPYCDFFLFDTKTPDYGGSGRSFDWGLLEHYEGDTPFLLSGGIDESMADSIQSIEHPQLLGVDINSRFETEPGLKDITKVNYFISKLKVI